MKIARRVGKSIPFVGGLVAMGFLAYAVKRKGVIGGVVDTTLDAIPFVGLVKNGIEIFNGDWIPDRPQPPAALTASAPAPRDPTSDTPS